MLAAPTEPLHPFAKRVNSTAILLSWDPPPLTGWNGPNVSYIVKYGWSGQFRVDLRTTDTSELIGGLSPYIPYEFKIAAVSANSEIGAFTDLFSGNITRGEFQCLSWYHSNRTLNSTEFKKCPGLI